MNEYEGCTAERRERAAQFTLAVVISEFINDNSTVADSGIVSCMCILLHVVMHAVHILVQLTLGYPSPNSTF